MSSRKAQSPSASQEGSQESFVQRALVLARPSAALNRVGLALTLQAKNLYNTAHFAVNNVRQAYERVAGSAETAVWRLKPELHEHQITALTRFNAAIDHLNTQRAAVYEAKKAQGGDTAEKAKLVVLPRFETEVASVYRSLLDLTVLDNVLRAWPDQQGTVVYKRPPAKAAQQVLRRYLDAWSGYFEASKEFARGNKAMTGRPRPPDYLAKRDRFVVELPLTQIGECLISLSGRTVPVDFEEAISLTEDELLAWSSYRIGEQVQRACARRGFPDGAKPQHLRIVPHKQGVKLEAVVRVPRLLPEGSLLAEFEQTLELPDRPAKRNAVLIDALRKAGATDSTLRELPSAGVDFGLNNTLAVSFSTGHRAQVVSGGRLDKVLGAFDERLDAWQTRLTSERARALQAKKRELQAAGVKLSRGEDMELRQRLKAVFADPTYRALRGARERWLKDYLHKLTHGVVAKLLKRGIRVLVLGQNKGWKNGSDLGAAQNRRFGNAAIGRIIELLRYKAEAHGIVVVTTEESYTSKTSFVANEPLKAHKSVEPAPDLLSGTAALRPSPTAPAATPQGKRLKHERHTFVNLNQTGRWAKVHADVNGAFNILRKVFLSFAFHAKLSLAYQILRVSPRLGLTPVRI